MDSWFGRELPWTRTSSPPQRTCESSDARAQVGSFINESFFHVLVVFVGVADVDGRGGWVVGGDDSLVVVFCLHSCAPSYKNDVTMNVWPNHTCWFEHKIQYVDFEGAMTP